MQVNIESVGPGLWYGLHLRAAKANGRRQRHKVLLYMEFLAKELPCPECRTHLANFLQKTRHLWRKIHDNETLLYYTWYLHTLVNKRKNKENVPFQVVFDFYDKVASECTEFCSAPQ